MAIVHFADGRYDGDSRHQPQFSSTGLGIWMAGDSLASPNAVPSALETLPPPLSLAVCEVSLSPKAHGEGRVGGEGPL